MATITIKIKDSRTPDAEKYISLAKPIPVDLETKELKYTFIEWMTYLGENYFKILYDSGVKKDAAQAASDNEIFE